LALHELTTNAANHGALSVSTGRVDVGWRVRSLNGTRDLHLTWAETGGPPVQAPARKGFGSRLIEDGLAHELDGTVRLDFDVGGVKCAIVAPLPPTESQP
jgi:two-component sensor histidine kinase